MTGSFVVAARRSAVAPRGGRFAALSLHDLAAPVVRQAIQDAGLPLDQVDEIIVSNALGAGGNPARSIALAAGLPNRVAGLTLDRQCAGGLDALLLADAMIRSGQHDVVVAGGVESYSRRPLRYRTFADGREPEQYDQAPFTPWPDRDPDMAEAADTLGKRLGIDRETQDRWAVNSHSNTRKSHTLTKEEIVTISDLSRDTFTRDLSMRHCARAPRVAGDITAANMAVAADAAAFAVLVSDRIAANLNTSRVEIIAGRTSGGDPECPGLAPVAAIEELLAARGLQPDDLCAAEIMEAFAVQAIACQQGARLPPEIVNRYGGGLARGHPVGASGAILAVRLFHLLSRENGIGLAAIAAAGGLGTALLMRSDEPANGSPAGRP